MSDVQNDIPESAPFDEPTPINRRRSVQWGALMTALAKAQGEIEGATKDAANPFFQSKYADLASVWRAIRAPLSKNGIAITQWPRVVSNGIEVETIMAHGEQYISDILWMPVGLNKEGNLDAQGVGSAITYCRRYSLMAIAGVAPEDDDGNAAVQGSAPGMAGGGGDFRRPGPRRSNWVEEARRDGTLDETRKKGELPKKAAAPNAREAKIKAAVDKRLDALKSRKDWTRAELDDFWKENGDWIDWMGDPTNNALTEYERFTVAFADAEVNIRPVDLA